MTLTDQVLMETKDSETYKSPDNLRARNENFYKTLERFNPLPEVGRKDLTVVSIALGGVEDTDVVRKYFSGFSFESIDYRVSMNGSADVVITRNPGILTDNRRWQRIYDAVYESLNDGGKLIATFVTREEAMFVAEKLKYTFYVKQVERNVHATRATYMVSEKFVQQVKDNLNANRRQFEEAGVDIDIIIEELEDSVGEIKSFEFDSYVLIAVKKEDECEEESVESEDGEHEEPHGEGSESHRGAAEDGSHGGHAPSHDSGGDGDHH